MEWWGWVAATAAVALVVSAVVWRRNRRASQDEPLDEAPSGQVWPRVGQGRQR